MESLKKLLLKHGATLVGFASVENLYNECDLNLPKSIDSVSEPIVIPHYPRAVSIAIAIPRDVILGIHNAPTDEYYNTYYSLNRKLDMLAEMGEAYLESQGYLAYAQTVNRTKEFGIFTTVMPHKTVAVNAGLGWIGKSALLVTPEYGSAIRITSILTDAPLETNGLIEHIRCGNCKQCQKACPGKAITGKLWDVSKGRDWIFDAMACRKKAREIASQAIGKEITLCGKCIESCPYTQKYVNS